MNIIFIAIIFFMFGATVGAIIGLFIAGVGKNNKEHEYYHEGFMKVSLMDTLKQKRK